MLSLSNCVLLQEEQLQKVFTFINWEVFSTRCDVISNTALPYNTGLFSTQASSVINGPVPAQVQADCVTFYTFTRQGAGDKQGALKNKQDLLCFKRYILY